MPVIVTNNFPPDVGGIQTYMERLASEFAAAGESVTVLAPHTPGDTTYDASQRYRVRRYALFPRFPLRRALEAISIALSLVSLLLAGTEKHVIASAWWPTGLLVGLLPRSLRGRLVVIAHGMEIKPHAGGVRMLLMRHAFARADAVLANSSFTKQLLHACGVTANVRVVPCGVDERVVTHSSSHGLTILSVGRLVERKGMDRTIEAVAILLARFPELRYEIVGDGPDRKRLEQLARRFGVEGHVAFLGKVSEDELSAAYARASCFSLPARRIGDDVEGFGIVYLEAAMAELPCVGGRDSGAVDAIADGETGLLVDGNDAEAIAAGLSFLLEDRVRAEAMGARARARAVSDFGWNDVAARIMGALAS